MGIFENIMSVNEEIEKAAFLSGRKPEDITLVAVTKTFPARDINTAILAGITNVGENRVQEMMSKIDLVCQNVNWHIIGRLQTNKIKYIAGRIALIQSVDSMKLLSEIEKRAGAAQKVQDVLIEVNIAEEESKAGIKKEDIYSLIEFAEELKWVKIRGLMVIPPIQRKKDENRLHFYNTKKLSIDIADKKYNNTSMEILSMGMSADFKEAILEGSTMIRVGSLIFGNRYNTKED